MKKIIIDIIKTAIILSISWILAILTSGMIMNLDCYLQGINCIWEYDLIPKEYFYLFYFGQISGIIWVILMFYFIKLDKTKEVEE